MWRWRWMVTGRRCEEGLSPPPVGISCNADSVLSSS